MTYEEAISILTKDRALCLFNPLTGDVGPLNEDCRMSAEAMNLAIDALEKQIPKMPDMWGDGYSEGEIVMESYECPKCGCIYDFDIDGKLNFCHNCGQAIDWSDDE